MDLRMEDGNAMCTMTNASYMADDDAELRRKIGEFGERMRRQQRAIKHVVVDATSVTGYFSIEAFGVLWNFARFHGGGITVLCPAVHVAEHVRKYFPNVKFPAVSPDAAVSAAA